MQRTIRLATRYAMLAAVIACSGDDATSPNGGVVFDPLPQAMLDAYCVRGTAVIGDTKSGNVNDDDCDAADNDPNDEGFYEIWRVRVADPRVVTFDLSSPFDNYLEVYAMTSHTQTSATVVLMAQNDDRSSGNLNALVSTQLNPGIDYFVVVSGYDYFETGSYSLSIR